MRSKIQILLTLFVLLIFLVFCSEDKNSPSEPTGPPIYENGSGSIGANGGTISISDKTSNLFGAKIEIPQNALKTSTNISILNAPSNIKLLNDTTVQIFSFEPEGVVFEEPVQITLPYNSNLVKSRINVYYLNPEIEEITTLPIENIDETNNLLTFSTNHFSYYGIDDDGVHANVELYYFNNKISTNVYFDGWNWGNNNGLAGIHTINWAIPFGNALNFLNNGEFVVFPSLYMVLRVSLKKEVDYWFDKNLETITLALKRTGEDKTKFGATLFREFNNGNYPLDLVELYSEESQNSNDRSTWFSGIPLIFNFDYEANSQDKYYIKAEWQLSSGASFDIILSAKVTEKYNLDTYKFPKTISEMEPIRLDADGNFVIDSFEKVTNVSPNEPSNPTPANNATEQPTSLTLSWDCSDPDGDPILYDVYFGKSSNPPQIASGRSNRGYVLNNLDENTTYYWKIIAKDDKGNSNESKVWYFKTQGGTTNTITVTKPNSTTVWTQGQQNVPIEWETGNLGGNVEIWLWKDDGGQPNNMELTSSTSNDGNYSLWDVPADILPNTNYRIRLYKVGDHSIVSNSDKFEIKGKSNNPPNIPTNPNPANNATEQPTSLTLSWDCSDPDGDPILYDVYFGKSSNPPQIASGRSNRGYVLNNLDENTTYYWKIIAKDDKGNSNESPIWKFTTVSGVSNNIIVTNPNSASIWTLGEQNVSIEWETGNLSGDVEIFLWRVNLSNKLTIAASTANDGSTLWNVPTTISTEKDNRIRIISLTDPTKYADSEPFEIKSNMLPSITVTNPNSATIWTLGEQNVSIEWETGNLSGDVEIFLWRVNLSNKLTIAASTANDGSTSWNVPTATSTEKDNRIRIISLTDPTKYADSEPFEIKSNLLPSITVTEPNSSTVWTQGDENVNITWEFQGITGDVEIILWNASTSTVSSVAPQTSNNGNFSSYDVPSDIEVGTQYQIIIRSSADNSIEGRSDYFEIKMGSNLMGVPCPGIPTITDNRNGKIYNTVLIGEQCWLKENMDIGTMIWGSEDQKSGNGIEKYCYDNDLNNCEKYGGLYQWDEAMQYVATEKAQGICPNGWHIPSDSDFNKLISKVSNDGNSLKALGEGTGYGMGTNTSGFSVLFSGYRGNDGSFNLLGISPNIWSSKAYNEYYAYRLFLGNTNSQIGYNYGGGRKDGQSVRCLKD